MTSQQILQADLLDILFEQRNKSYGAYQLRKTYHRQLVKAVVVALSSVLVLLFFFKPSYSKAAFGKDEGKVVVVENLALPPEQKKPEQPKIPPAPKTAVRQQLFIDLIAIKEQVTTPVPPVDALKNVAISNITTVGADVNTLQPPPIAEARGTGNAGRTGETESAKELAPDKQPQFPGGMQAWLAFLSRNLHAPEELESGEKKTVVIRFHVAEDGSIANFQVEQSAGSAFDEEVIRVLRKMPRWTPAMQAGRPVSVSFTQPVTFVGVEE